MALRCRARRRARQALWVGFAALLLSARAEGETPHFVSLSDSQLFSRSVALERKLETRVTIQWKDVPLRDAAERLARTQGLAIWIDRRVDPSEELELDADRVTLRKLCGELAAALELGTTQVGDVIYVGPPSAANELRTLVAIGNHHALQMDPGIRTAMQRRAPMAIGRLETPRDLVTKLAESLGVRVENPQAIPYDLWEEKTLPPLAGSARLNFVLVGFDLTWETADKGRAIRIVPIRRPVVVEREVVLGPTSEDQLKDILANDPVAKVRRAQKSTLLTARVEQHEAISKRSPDQARAHRQPSQNAGKQVYSLNIQEQPVGQLLKQLATKLELKLILSDGFTSNKEQLDRRITFSVDQVDLAGLMAAIAREAELEVELDGDAIRVAPSR